MLNLKRLSDHDLLGKTKKLVTQERELLTHILSSLREVDLRRLYSELGYKSLFEYAVKELKYSEGQAGRRIQALRLIKEIPRVEKKIESGKLSLSNICRAQSFFRETKKNTKAASLKIEDKIEILQKLENKSSRDGERLLMALSPATALPKERKRIIDDQHTQVSFIINEELNTKLESIRSLLSPSEQNIPLAELVNIMADHSLQALKAKKFGKKRMAKANSEEFKRSAGNTEKPNVLLSECVDHNSQLLTEVKLSKNRSTGNVEKPKVLLSKCVNHNSQLLTEVKFSKKRSAGNTEKSKVLLSECLNHNSQALTILKFGKKNRLLKAKSEDCKSKNSKFTPPPELQSVKSKSRYISQALKYHIYQRDEFKCKHCGSMKNLNIDHIQPLAKDGFTEVNNLRLLCFSCNQRAAIKEFGLNKMLKFNK